LGRQFGDQVFDLFDSLVLGAGEELSVVFWGEVSFEAVDATQVDFAAGDHIEQHRKATRGSGSADAFARRGFGHVKPHHAEVEHRRVPPLGPELSPIDGVDVAQKRSSVLLVVLNEPCEPLEQRTVAHV
jgi:hypothetical protein